MTTDVRAPSSPIYLAGEFVETANALEIRNPADGSLVGSTFQAGADELERATVADASNTAAIRAVVVAVSTATNHTCRRQTSHTIARVALNITAPITL